MLPIQFMLRKPGYVTAGQMLRIPAVKPETPEATLELKITPTAVLTGHVYAESGQLPAGMFVQLRRLQVQNGSALWQPSSGSQVGSGGQFRIANLQPGDYKLMTSGRVLGAVAAENRRPQPASITGMLPSFYPGADSLDSAAVIHLAPGQTATADLTARTAPFYRVTVPVSDLDAGRGVGANIRPEFGFNLNFSSQNHQLQGYLPSGSYTVRVTWMGEPPSTAVDHLQVSGAPVDAPAVHPAAASELPVIVHREFTGSLAENVNNTMPSVYVNLQPVDPQSGATAAMAPARQNQGDDGLSIQNLSEGLYHVIVFPRMGYVASVTSGSTDLLRDPLAVSSAGSAEPIEITLRDDFATLDLHVQPAGPAGPDAATQPSGSAQVFLLLIPLDRLQTQGFVISWPPTGQNEYTLPRQPPGRYLVLASLDQATLNNIEYHNPDVLRKLLAQGAQVTLVAGEKTDAQVTLMPEEANE